MVDIYSFKNLNINLINRNIYNIHEFSSHYHENVFTS